MLIGLLFLAAGLTFVNPLCEAAKRRFTVADDIGVAHFGDPYLGKVDPVTFSPDGRYFVVDTERGLLDQDRPESTLRIYRTEQVCELLLRPEIAGEPSPVWMLSKSTYKDGSIITHIRWLNDSSGIAFLAKTAGGNDQLFLADLKTRTIEALTPENQHVTGFDIRDREHFVFTVLSPRMGEKALAESQATSVVGTGRSLNSLLFPENLYPSMSRLHDLSELWAVVNGKRFRVDSGSSGRPVFLHSDGQSALALSPNGRSIVTVTTVNVVPTEWETLYRPPLPFDPYRIRAGRQDPEAFDGHMYVSEYVWIDLSTGQVKPLTNAPIGKNADWWSVPSADWSSDSESVVLLNTFLQSRQKGLDSVLVRPCVAVVDVADDSVTCLEPLKGKAKTIHGAEDGYHAINSVRFARGSGKRVTVDYWELDDSKQAPDDWSKKSTSYARLEDGSWTVAGTTNGWTQQDLAIEVDVKESFNDPPVLVATDKGTKASRVILDPNPQLQDVEMGQASVYKWKDKNGRDWVGGLYKPPDYVQGRRYPLVVQTHGFFETLFRPSGIYPTAFAARELAAAEILVLQVPHCPYTVDLEEVSCNVVGIEAGVEKLVADGVVDPGRAGIVGFSRTCFYVLAILTRSFLRFKAASITEGVNFGYLEYITNVDSDGNALVRESSEIIGASPFGEGLQQWFKRSPEFNLDKMRAPLLVVAKGRPELLEMWEPYAALRYLNRPVDLIMLREGTHVLTNPAERVASQGGTVDWFRFWLKDEEDADSAKAAQYARWRELKNMQEENDAKDKAAKEKAAATVN